MWNTRKLPFLVFIFTAFFYKASGKSRPLDMAPDAVDDLYKGCRDEAMAKFVKSDMLTQELDQNENFKKAWNEGSKCSKLISGGMKEHMTALSAMASENENFLKAFDKAVKTMGTNVSTYENFTFKSLHFLLIDAMKLSKNLNAKQCRTVYYLSERTHTAKIDSKVRLGQFTIAYTNYKWLKEMEDWDRRSIFNITTCFFFNLGEDSCSEDKEAILLSPAEVFTVKYMKDADEKSENTYSEIVLEQPELGNSHNCYSFSRSPADGSALWLVLLLAILPPLL